MCKFCGDPALYHPEICQKCVPVLQAVEDAKPSALEAIIRDVNIRRFLLIKSKQK